MSLIKQDLISSSKYKIKCPYDMNPIGICIHNTYNDAPAKNEISYMKSNSNQVSYHIAVDDNEAIQAIPFNRNAFASGDGSSGTGNRKYIHIEICYSKSGGSKFANAEKLASKVVAELLNRYKWNISDVKAHRDFSNKNCPHRTNMNEFKKLVESELSQDGWYKYEKGWSYWENGKWIYNSWRKIKNEWYYFDSNGYSVVGWLKLDDKWYYFNSDCKMQTGWVNVNGKDYYLHGNGAMENNHIDLNGKCYHFASNGELVKTVTL